MKLQWGLALVLIAAAGAFLFFFSMYRGDIKALEGFMASYETFDKAVSDLAASDTDDLENRVRLAGAALGVKASLRLSSLIKNDAGLMDQALEIADLARREIESYRACKLGIRNENAEGEDPAVAFRSLTAKRKAAYARFQELGGVR